MRKLFVLFFFVFFAISCGNAEDVSNESNADICDEQGSGECEECPSCSTDDVTCKSELDPCEGMVPGEACMKEYCLDGNCSFVSGIKFCEDGEYTCYASCSPVENCNTPEIDENCNGLTNEGCDQVVDVDEDGDPDETDCAPKNPDISHFAVEECNELDDDCDGETDEDFNLKSDSSNCGKCGHQCGSTYDHAAETCFSSKCQFLSCMVNYKDLNSDISEENQDGCECHEPSGEGCVCLETAPNAISHWVYDEEKMYGSCELICVGWHVDVNEDMADGCECNFEIGEGCPPIEVVVVDTDEDGDPDETDCAPKNPDISHFAVEECNELDDDCDGETDEDFNFYLDYNNCGKCGLSCANYFANAQNVCMGGQCIILSCLWGMYANLNEDLDDGCECYQPTGEGCVCLETAPNAISYWVYDDEKHVGSCELICVGGHVDANEDMADGCECNLETDEGCPPIEVELEAGDIIVLEGTKNKFYYAENGARYTLPYGSTGTWAAQYDDAILDSWFPYGYEVKTLSMEQMVQIPLLGNVTIRPGTWLVRISTVPKVYAIEAGGVLRQVADQTVLQNLFSQSWEAIAPTDQGFALLKIVPDGFWPNYTSSEESLDGTIHPTGTLVYCWSFSPDVYYIDEGSKRLVADLGFIENNFATQFVIPLDVSTCADYLGDLPEGDPIEGWEYELSLDYELLYNYEGSQ